MRASCACNIRMCVCVCNKACTKPQTTSRTRPAPAQSPYARAPPHAFKIQPRSSAYRAPPAVFLEWCNYFSAVLLTSAQISHTHTQFAILSISGFSNIINGVCACGEIIELSYGSAFVCAYLRADRTISRGTHCVRHAGKETRLYRAYERTHTAR